jgi:hypothetical protein
MPGVVERAVWRSRLIWFSPSCLQNLEIIGAYSYTSPIGFVSHSFDLFCFLTHVCVHHVHCSLQSCQRSNDTNNDWDADPPTGAASW